MARGLGFTASEYKEALKKLLPQGPAWNLEDDSVFIQMLDVASCEFARIDADISRLILESDARTASVTLLEWFDEWGIPDECLKLLGEVDLETYRKVLVAKISTLGFPFGELISLIAKALGYSGVKLGTFQAFTVGSRVDQHIYDRRWKSSFTTVTTDDTPTVLFRADSRVNQRLKSWGDELWECMVKSLAPAHCNIIFQYGNNSF